MKKILFVLLLISAVAAAQNFNGRVSYSLYSFERFDTENNSETFLRQYQTFVMNLNSKQFALRTRFSMEADLLKPLDKDPRVRFYNFYFEGRNIWDIATFKLGRQSLINGIAGGVYDGISLDLKKWGLTLNGFFGGNVPAYQKFDISNDFNNDYVLGGKLTANVVDNFRFGFSYIDKNFKPLEYEAIRLDENYDPITVLIRRNSNQFRFASAEASYYMNDVFDINTKVDYDLNFETLSKFELSGRYEQIKDLGINFYYNFREPTIRYNSIFSVFNYGNTHEIEGGLDYKIDDNFTVSGKFAHVTYEDEDAQRLGVGLISNWGSIHYRKTFGYAGELDAVSLYSARSYFDGYLTPSAGIAYTSYKLSPDAETNNIISALAGVNVRPFRALSFDLQGQYFNNKIYNNDLRFFFKINYWFNTNLDVM